MELKDWYCRECGEAGMSLLCGCHLFQIHLQKWDSCIFSFLKKLYTVPKMAVLNLHSHQLCIKAEQLKNNELILVQDNFEIHASIFFLHNTHRP